MKILEFHKMIFGTFQIDSFWNIPSWKFLEFYNLDIFLIFQIAKFQNFLN